MLRRGGKQLLQQVQQLRGFAAEAALVEESPFLRFGQPFAPQLNLNAALAQLPETKVRDGACRGAPAAGGGPPCSPPLPPAAASRLPPPRTPPLTIAAPPRR